MVALGIDEPIPGGLRVFAGEHDAAVLVNCHCLVQVASGKEGKRRIQHGRAFDDVEREAFARIDTREERIFARELHTHRLDVKPNGTTQVFSAEHDETAGDHDPFYATSQTDKANESAGGRSRRTEL